MVAHKTLFTSKLSAYLKSLLVSKLESLSCHSLRATAFKRQDLHHSNFSMNVSTGTVTELLLYLLFIVEG